MPMLPVTYGYARVSKADDEARNPYLLRSALLLKPPPKQSFQPDFPSIAIILILSSYLITIACYNCVKLPIPPRLRKPSHFSVL